MPFRAEANDFDSLHAAFRARAEMLGATRLELDALCGTADAYMSKFLNPLQTRKGHLGTLGKVLKGLGLRLIVVEDQKATRKTLARINKPRDETRVRHRRELPAATGAPA
jgi:hypothetical protein